jgi:2-oxoglutarate ferredoxin oxidoreductase subunit beta
MEAALRKAFEWGDRIPLGVIYQAERPIYEESEPVLKRGPLVKQPLGIEQSRLDELLAETM